MDELQIGFDEYIKELESNKVVVKHHEPIVYALYDYMKKHHVGKDNAIASEELANMFGITDRELRNVVHDIRMSGELEKIVVSTNKGYYMATEGEADAVICRLIKHGAEEIKVARMIAAKQARNGQMKLQLGPYYKAVYESVCAIEDKKGEKND